MTVALNLGSYADISDYSSLVEKLKLWLDRGSDLDAQIPTFISLIEPYLNRTLRTPDMEATTFPVITAGGFSLPPDCLAVRSLSMNGVPLDAMAPGQMAGAYGTPAGIITGCPRAYAISGRAVSIAPVSAGTAALSYWQRIPALTIAAPTNWLLTAHPDVYLYGALAQADGYIENPERAAQWTGLFEAAVQSVTDAAGKARWGGPIRARATTQVRGVRA